jgi:N,N-dimethylformamidase
MLDALHSYVESGGKLMYLGGNGFYWVTSVAPERPHVIEVRRGAAGTRTWSSEPGELYHSTTGEIGGLWRHRGRPPNLLVGVGFSAMGDGGSGYLRLEGSFREEVSFVFRGLGEDEVIGDFGAAGDEVDRLDADLGSPPDAVLLASATSLNQSYQTASEDQVVEARDEAKNPGRRADMVYHQRASGGAVFSVGSITWFVSIGFNHDQNNVARVTENVLRHFLGQV